MQHIEPYDAVFFRESQLIFLTCSAIKYSPDTLQFRGEITEWPEIHHALFYEATKKKRIIISNNRNGATVKRREKG